MHRRITRPLAALACTLLAAAGALTAQQRPAEAAVADEFQQVTLAKGVAETGEPMTLAVLPDRSVLHTSRDGTLRLTDAAGTTKVAGKLDVYSHDEEGLQGIGVDPGFSSNRFVYLYYAPKLTTPAATPPGTERQPTSLRTTG
ncbi:hypothetical protein Sfulv_01890 [Streptomyces fulvorobeus]|uniref:Glucose/Sorbosone dehydrogenase domain-containing protein n=1 Tax=Streptomyces fulvorobeus TaxID=284028 RepID=A0A7J0BYR8_9ACTN|nr:hypothetical protein Sfulv_01890 [Streptomyces fulvorobeus]